MRHRFFRCTVAALLAITILACSFPFGLLQKKQQAAQATLYAQLFEGTPLPPDAIPPVEKTQQAAVQTESPDATPQSPQPSQAQKFFTGLNIVPPNDMVASPFFDTSAIENYNYITQPGDTLSGLLGRFNVDASRFSSSGSLPKNAYLPSWSEITIPNQFKETSLPYAIFPDSAVVYSPCSADFDIAGYIQEAGGYLTRHTETVDGKKMTGAEIVSRLAIENSINPRLLLAFLDFHTSWVSGQPPNPSLQYPIGFMAPSHQGLYGELSLVIRQLTIGYYGWRKGDQNSLLFGNQTSLMIYPGLNAGSAAVLKLFSVAYSRGIFTERLYGGEGFVSFYYNMFGDPWVSAASIEPLLTGDLAQPGFELPFAAGERWVLTGGPHNAWGVGSPNGGLDFAPSAVEPGCGVSKYWVTASASGVVTRSDDGVLVIDMDGDGQEQTGWALVYLHIAAKDRPEIGAEIMADQPIGHPSCEGGKSTGTHIHISRKYNGEWMGAGYPVPFILSGWQASPGTKPYQGFLQKEDKTVSARSDGSSPALIIR